MKIKTKQLNENDFENGNLIYNEVKHMQMKVNIEINMKMKITRKYRKETKSENKHEN